MKKYAKVAFEMAFEGEMDEDSVKEMFERISFLASCCKGAGGSRLAMKVGREVHGTRLLPGAEMSAIRLLVNGGAEFEVGDFKKPAEPVAAAAPSRVILNGVGAVACQLEGLNQRILEMNLPVMSGNALFNDGLRYAGHLVVKTERELLDVGGFGRKSLADLKVALGNSKLTLGMTLEGWTPPET